MAVPQFTANNRLAHGTATEVDTKYASLRPKDALPTAGVEDATPFTNVAASQRTNSRMALL